MSELESETRSEKVSPLTKDNYQTWRMKAEALLDVSSLWDYVTGEKKLRSEDAEELQKEWKTKDKRAKSMLILHISETLLPLVEDCKTSNEVWLKLENVYGNKSSEIDEDDIINDIEESVDDFFETLNDPSEKDLSSEKKSLNFADKLFLRLEKDGLKKLPDKKIIAGIVNQFIIDMIDKLSKSEIEERKIELSGKLIDDLLLKFDINPHKHDNDDAEVAETPKKTVDDTRGKKDNDGISIKANRILLNAIDALAENKIAQNDTFEFNPLHESTRIGRELCGEQGGCGNYPFPNLCTPPATPSPKQTRKCGVCRAEGHNRTTCPLNKTVNSPASKSCANKSTVTPSRSQNCGVCGSAGHNKTTCPLNTSVTSSSKSTANTATPRKSYKCGICGDQGHNRTTCSLNKTVSSASKSSSQTVGTPSRSYSCGMCGVQGHNRTTCPLNNTVSSPSLSLSRSGSSTPSRSYRCGACGIEGHNRTTCPLNKTVSSPSLSLSRSVSSTPSRSYHCGACGIEGHNRTSCPSLKSVTSSPQSYANSSSTPARSYSCGTCGGQGHNSRTCSAGRNNSLSSSGYGSSYSYSSPVQSYAYSSPSYSGGGGRRYTCGNCGGSGHNRRTCSG